MGFDVIDGELWDVETGEYAGPASSWIRGDETPEDLALLVMRKRMDIEANIMAEKAKMEAELEKEGVRMGIEVSKAKTQASQQLEQMRQQQRAEQEKPTTEE